MNKSHHRSNKSDKWWNHWNICTYSNLCTFYMSRKHLKLNTDVHSSLQSIYVNCDCVYLQVNHFYHDIILHLQVKQSHFCLGSVIMWVKYWPNLSLWRMFICSRCKCTQRHGGSSMNFSSLKTKVSSWRKHLVTDNPSSGFL